MFVPLKAVRLEGKRAALLYYQILIEVKKFVGHCRELIYHLMTRHITGRLAFDPECKESRKVLRRSFKTVPYNHTDSI